MLRYFVQGSPVAQYFKCLIRCVVSVFAAVNADRLFWFPMEGHRGPIHHRPALRLQRKHRPTDRKGWATNPKGGYKLPPTQQNRIGVTPQATSAAME